MKLLDPGTINYTETNTLFQQGRLIRIEENGNVRFEASQVNPWISLREEERFLLDEGGHPVDGLHNGLHTCGECERYQNGKCQRWHATVWFCWPSCSTHFTYKKEK